MKSPTEPMQAQIEAAKQAFYDRKLDEAGVGLNERFAAALIAAAQVGNRRQAFYDQAGTGAAAEVGDEQPSVTQSVEAMRRTTMTYCPLRRLGCQVLMMSRVFCERIGFIPLPSNAVRR